MDLTKEERDALIAEVREGAIAGVLDKLKERWWGTEREQLIHEVSEVVREARSGPRAPLGAPCRESPITVVTSEDVPLGVEWEASPDGALVSADIVPRRGHFYVKGVRSFNRPGEIWVNNVSRNGSGFDNAVASGFDSATYLLDHGRFKDMPLERHLAYYRVNWGVCSLDWPIQVVFRRGDPGLVELPKLRWTVYGTLEEKIPDYYGASVPLGYLPARSPHAPEGDEG